MLTVARSPASHRLQTLCCAIVKHVQSQYIALSHTDAPARPQLALACRRPLPDRLCHLFLLPHLSVAFIYLIAPGLARCRLSQHDVLTPDMHCRKSSYSVAYCVPCAQFMQVHVSPHTNFAVRYFCLYPLFLPHPTTYCDVRRTVPSI